MAAFAKEMELLSRQLSQAHRAAIQAELLAAGLEEVNHPMLVSLLQCAEEDPASCQAQRDLAQQLYVSPAAVANSLKGLERSGYIRRKPWRELLPYLDAANIDLKGFTPEWYRRLGGDLDTVKRSIALAAERCHVEVTTLLVPGENDSVDEVRALAGKSSAAAQETTVLLRETVDSMDEGVQAARDTADSMLAVVAHADEMNTLIDSIAGSTQKQDANAEEITRGIGQISTVVQTNVATAEESAAASEELSGQASVLRDLVARFQLRDL